MTRRTTLALLAAVSLRSRSGAQFSGGGGSFGGDNSGGSRWDNGDDGDNNDGSPTRTASQGSPFSSQPEFDRATRILIVHAVMASLVWVIFIPSLAILLRLNIKSPAILRVHAVGQIMSYIIYIGAAGMGVWLAQQSAAYGVWHDPHPRLGLAILVMAFFQPILGAVHHRVYKKRVLNAQAGERTKEPGRTWVGRVHLWLGRLLIVLGMVNGGLGIRLASFSPFQSDATSNKAGIAYGVIAAVVFALYLIFVIVFEVRRRRALRAELQNGSRTWARKKPLPTYAESEQSVGGNIRYS